MDLTESIRFLEEKLHALTSSEQLYPATGASIREGYELHLQAAKSDPAQARRILKSLDKELDVTMRSFLPKSEIARIALELKKRYGFSSLSNTGDAIAKRALRRGGPKDADEAQAIRDFLLSEEYAIEVLGAESVSKLEGMLVQYEQAHGA